MDFLLIIGIPLLMIGLFLRNRLQLEVDEDSCDIEAQEKAVKGNKIWLKICLIGGPIMIALGILGFIL